jgi:hypothetical protein
MTSTIADRYLTVMDSLKLPVWRAGMLSNHGARYLGTGLWANSTGVTFADPNEGEEPDFSDPATLGCLMAAAREAWKDPRLCTYPEKRWWGTFGVDGDDYLGIPKRPSMAVATTEAEALIVALEAAVALRASS